VAAPGGESLEHPLGAQTSIESTIANKGRETTRRFFPQLMKPRARASHGRLPASTLLPPAVKRLSSAPERIHCAMGATRAPLRNPQPRKMHGSSTSCTLAGHLLSSWIGGGHGADNRNRARAPTLARTRWARTRKKRPSVCWQSGRRHVELDAGGSTMGPRGSTSVSMSRFCWGRDRSRREVAAPGDVPGADLEFRIRAQPPRASW
jgi:hypothetical protein